MRPTSISMPCLTALAGALQLSSIDLPLIRLDMPRKKPDDYERVRGSKACTFCSRRKIKCNGLEPCSACDARSIQCAYPRAKKRGPPSKLERQRKQDLDTEASPSESPSSPSSSISQHHQAAAEQPSTQGKRARFEPFDRHAHGGASPRFKSALESLADMAQISTAPSPRREPSTFAFDAFALTASLGSQPSTSSAYSPFSSHGQHASMPSTARSDLAPPVLGDRTFDADSSSLTFQPTTVSFDADADAPSQMQSPVYELSTQVVDQLLTIYQYFVHLHWPIIYLPSLSSLRVLAQSHPLLFNAVLAVAAGTQDSCDSASQHTHFGVASSSVPSPYVCPPGTASKLVRYLKQHVKSHHMARDIETVQVLILLALVEIGGGQSSDAHLHATMACTYAIDLGLHRHSAALSSDQSAGRAQERSRVLWGCYVLDKTLAAALERPMMLRASDIEVELPSTDERDEYDIFVNDQSRHFVAPDRAAGMADVKCRCISSFRASCELMMILERILVDIYSPKARRARSDGHCESYLLAVVEIDGVLQSWRQHLSSHLQWSSADSGGACLSSSLFRGKHRVSQPQGERDAQDNVPPQVLTMRAWYSACMLLLHRPRLALDQSVRTKIFPLPSDGTVTPKSPPRTSAQDASSDDSARKATTGASADTSAKSKQKDVLAISGSKLVRAAATEICNLLPKYRSTFSVRRIPSSWVYLIFQSAVIHSSFLERDEPSSAFDGEALEAHEDRDGAETASKRRSNDSKRLFQQCIRSLEQMSLTWRGASHHVATLRRVAQSFRITRPSTPTPAQELLFDPPNMLVGSGPSQAPANDGLASFDISDAVPNPTSVSMPATMTPTEMLAGPGGGAQTGNTAATLDWPDFWNQMPASSEDVWVWQQFINAFGNAAA